MDSNPSLENQKRARETIQKVQAGLKDHPNTSLPKVIQIIKELTGKIDEVSVDRLAELIGRDLVTVTRIMEIARTIGYNPEGVEITNITQAIHVIGFNKIRNLAVSLLISQNAAQLNTPEETQEISLLSLAGGFVAQAVMRRQHQAISDEAFICGALKCYGQLLLSIFLLEDYRRACDLSHDLGSDKAYEEVFGLTPMELSFHLLKSAQLPKIIVKSLRIASPRKIESVAFTAEDELLLASEFSVKLCKLLNNRELTQDEFSAQADALLRTYHKNIFLQKEDFESMFADACGKLNAFREVLGRDPSSFALYQHLHQVSEGREIRPVARRNENETPLAPSSHSSNVFDEGIAEVEQLMLTKPVPVKAVLELAARIIAQGLGLDDCIALIRDPRGKGFSAVAGTEGALLSAVFEQKLVDPAAKSIFSICLSREEDVIARDPADPRISPYIPDWIKTHADHHPFILLPLRNTSGTVAIFCGFNRPENKLSINTSWIQDTKRLRKLLRPLF